MTTECPKCGATIELGPEPTQAVATCGACGHQVEVFDEETIITLPAAGGQNTRLPPPPALPGVKDARPEIPGYQLVREVGRGGMGVVWDAIQLSLGRHVALKVLTEQFARDPHFVARFEREAEALARLSHPNIVPVIDRGRVGDVCYFVMEYVQGEGGGPPTSVRALIDERRLDSGATHRLATQMCQALAFAHGQGVVHRDIKPGNVLIDMHGSGRIVDFGIADLSRAGERAGPRLTLTGSAVGTPVYMAPEQQTDAAGVDHRADIYAVGVMLYEMLTGQLPYGSFDPPSVVNELLDPQWDAIVAMAMRPSPKDRFADMGQMLAALERVTAEEIPVLGPAAQSMAAETTGSREAPVAGKCPACGGEAGADRQFCVACGAKLRRACPSCGLEQPAWEHFCGGCGTDLRALDAVARHLGEAKELVAQLDDGEGNPVETFERCEQARGHLHKALQADGQAKEPARMLSELEARRSTLAVAAADYAIERRSYGVAAELCRRVLEVEPEHAGARSRLEKATAQREAMLAKATDLRNRGALRKALGVLSEAARFFPDDEEVESLHERVDGELSRITESVRVEIPKLRKTRRFAALARLLDELSHSGARIRGLESLRQTVNGKLEVASKYQADAKAAADAGNTIAACDHARQALTLVADLPEARALLDQIETQAADQIRTALADERWFTAKALLSEEAKLRPSDRRIASKLQEMEERVHGRANAARLIAWTAGGAALWLTAQLAALLLMRVVPVPSGGLSLGTATISQSDLLLAQAMSLRCAVAVVLLAALTSMSRGSPLWEAIGLLLVALAVGPLAAALPRLLDLGAVLAPMCGSEVDGSVIAQSTLELTLTGLVFAGLACRMFEEVGAGLTLFWPLCALAGSLAALCATTWEPGTAGGEVAGVALSLCFGLAVASMLASLLLVRGWWHWLTIAGSVLCYGLFRAAELTGMWPVALAGGLVAGGLFGAIAQLGAGRGALRRPLTAVASAGLWGLFLILARTRTLEPWLQGTWVWLLWCGTLRVGLRGAVSATFGLKDVQDCRQARRLAGARPVANG